MKGSILPSHSVKVVSKPSSNISARRLVIACLGVVIIWNALFLPKNDSVPHSRIEKFRHCAIENYLATGLKFLDSAERPPVDEYVQRRNNLAKALAAEGADAFIVEPGFTFSYYANITQTDWEPWEPEERPFLMIIRPQTFSDGQIIANTSFFVPHFEETRARLLQMPFQEEIHAITYEEHWNYYTTLYESEIWGGTLSPVLMVDEEMRDFIQRGLSSNGFTVHGLNGEVEAVRQAKTEREIEILRAVNTGTVEAIRAMRKCLYPGVMEREVKEVLDDTLRAAGLDPFFDIVEFGKSAALPHGGYDGTRKLESGMFVLIDVGAHLYGYSSDVTRTFYPPFFPESASSTPNVIEQLQVWKIVLDAQAAAVQAMRPNDSAAAVDIAARMVIETAGYGDYFTHRLGHGIGVKAHESPYLNKGNFGAKLRAGMVFTAEPGVYILDDFGVRHEDVLLVKVDGEAENISGGYAESPWKP